MLYSYQILDKKTVTHSFNYLFTCHREKPVFEEEMQTTVLKKHENSHFLTSEFHSGCKNRLRIYTLLFSPDLLSKLFHV